ncbi:glycosyltransferase [Methylobacterium sp. P31]
MDEKANSHADHRWLSADTPVLVACGRLTEQKNYPMMLRVVANLQERMSVRLLILGEGPDREALEGLAEALKIRDLVEFVGFVEAPQAYFSKARLFISTSNWEGLPMTLIEALYCGANFVTTDSCSAASDLTASGRFGACVARGTPPTL